MMGRLAIIAVGLIMIISALGSIGIRGENVDIVTGTLTVHNPIRIDGNSQFTSLNGIVNGTGTSDDPYIIENLMINATGYGYGIYIGNTTRYLTIRNCEIWNATMSDPDFYDPNGYGAGITLKNANFVTIVENHLHDNTMDVQLFRSNNNSIDRNICGSDHGHSNLVLHMSSDNDMVHNTIDTHNLVDIKNQTTGQMMDHGIDIYHDCFDNLIRGNMISNHSMDGISIINSGSDRTTIERNVIRKNLGDGIEITGAGNKVCDNIIDLCKGIGVYADMNYNGIFAWNSITNCGYAGMEFNYDNGAQSEGCNIVRDNIVRYNGKYGIRVMGKDSVYHNNTVSDNKGDGFNIWKESGDGNKVYQNNISSNQGHGIFVQRHWQVPSTGNKIWMNNIIDNSIQGLDDCLENQWNGSSIGNYWSDLNGPDSDGDGIVDMPYVVNTTTRAADMKPAATPFDIKTEGPIIPPRIITEDIESVFVNDTYNVTYEAYDPYIVSKGLDWDVQTNASWLIVIGSRICGIPRLPDVGTYWVSIDVSDGKEIDSREFTLNVVLAADNGTDPGDDPGNDTDPGDDPDNGTDPGDDPGNDTDPGDDPGNDTSPGDGDGNDSDPGSDPGDGTDPGDGPGNGSEPGDDVPNDQNDTDNDENVIWTQETNNPPASADIYFPTKRIVDGEPFTLTASAFDPDLLLGDALTYEWYIDGMGLVGTGDTITVTLPEGSYTVHLVVTDHYGLKIEKTVSIDVGGAAMGSKGFSIYLMGLVGVAVIGLMIAALFIVRRAKFHREAIDFEEPCIDADVPDYAPINLSNTLMSSNPIRTGKLSVNDTGNRTRTGIMRPCAVSGLSMAESRMMKEIEKEALISERAPARYKRRELRDLLRRREPSMDRETFLAVRSILEE